MKLRLVIHLMTVLCSPPKGNNTRNVIVGDISIPTVSIRTVRSYMAPSCFLTTGKTVT